MSYRLGIDLGTSFTAAAVCSLDEERARPELVPLGARDSVIPTVAFPAEDGTLVFGERAGTRCVAEPDRLIRDFRRRVGDPVPIVVNGVAHEARAVAARFVESVVERVTEWAGARPDALSVTHPAAWGTHECRLFDEALADRGMRGTELLPEPEAAAVARTADLKINPGSTVAVCDFGGGTCDAAIVRGHARGGFELRGAAQGLDALGGADFDEAVLGYVRARLGSAWSRLDPADPATRPAVAALRRECTAAKEALSAETEVTIPVLLPGLRSRVRLTRGDFEDMIVPGVGETVGVLEDALSAAGLSAADLSAILLLGGSSRIPLITQSLFDQFELPVVGDADPKETVALGAALSGQRGRIELGLLGVASVPLTPRRVSAEVDPFERATARQPVSAVRTYRGRTVVFAGAAALALLAGSGSLPPDSSPRDGAREVIAIPGEAHDGWRAGPGVGARENADGQAPRGAENDGSGGRKGSGGIDPSYGRQRARTVTPERAGANSTEGILEVTDKEPRPVRLLDGGKQPGSGADGRSGDPDTRQAVRDTSDTKTLGTEIGGDSGAPEEGEQAGGMRARSATIDGASDGGTATKDGGTATQDGGTETQDGGTETQDGGTATQDGGTGTSRSDGSPTSSTDGSSTGSTTEPSGGGDSTIDPKLGSGEQNSGTQEDETTESSEPPSDGSTAPEPAPSEAESTGSGAGTS